MGQRWPAIIAYYWGEPERAPHSRSPGRSQRFPKGAAETVPGYLQGGGAARLECFTGLGVYMLPTKCLGF